MSALRRTGKVFLARLLGHAAPTIGRARRAIHGPEIRVLGFHRVVNEIDALGEQVIRSLCITTRSFQQLLEYAAQRYQVMSLTEAAEALSGRRPLERDALVITFDDAYRDVFARALPILIRLKLPATVFVPTGYVDSDRPLLHDRLHALLVQARHRRCDLRAAPVPKLLRMPLARAEQILSGARDRAPRHTGGPLGALDFLIEALPSGALRRIADGLEDLVAAPETEDPGGRVMSSAELRACVAGGLTLGAHTVDHLVLTHEPPQRVRRELERPRRQLEELTGEPCTAFAYCNGLHSPSLREAVLRAGYAIAVTTRDAPNRIGQEPLALGRKVIWEGHVRGPFGFSPSLAAAHLDDLFRFLGTRVVDGERAGDGVDSDLRRRRNA